MIIACLNVYNEAETIERSIRSTLEHGCEKVVVVDGAYVGFPTRNGVEWSTDGTLEIVKRLQEELPVDLIPCPMGGWERQAVKRSAYFTGSDGDWYLVLDGDEELVDLKKEFVPLGDFALAQLEETGEQVGHYITLVPRIFRHVPGIKYATHVLLTQGDGHDLYLNLAWVSENTSRLSEGEGFFSPESYVAHIRTSTRPTQERRMVADYKQEQYNVERIYQEIVAAHNVHKFGVSAAEAVDRVTLLYWEHLQRLGPPHSRMQVGDVHKIVSYCAERWDNKRAWQEKMSLKVAEREKPKVEGEEHWQFLRVHGKTGQAEELPKEEYDQLVELHTGQREPKKMIYRR